MRYVVPGQITELRGTVEGFRTEKFEARINGVWYEISAEMYQALTANVSDKRWQSCRIAIEIGPSAAGVPPGTPLSCGVCGERIGESGHGYFAMSGPHRCRGPKAHG